MFVMVRTDSAFVGLGYTMAICLVLQHQVSTIYRDLLVT